MASNAFFEHAVEFIIEFLEGTVLSTGEQDPGNWTSGEVGVGIFKGSKFGISAASYPDIDFDNFDIEEAIEIFFQDYWNPSGCEYLPEDLAFMHLDHSINAGVAAARKILQEVENLANTQVYDAFKGYVAKRLEHYMSMRNWKRYYNTWTRRIMLIMEELASFTDVMTEPVDEWKLVVMDSSNKIYTTLPIKGRDDLIQRTNFQTKRHYIRTGK